MATEPLFDFECFDEGYEENGTRSRARKPHEGGWCATCFLTGWLVATFITAATMVVVL